MASSWYKVSFKYIFIHHWSIISKISKKYETSQYESSHSAWYETEHQFSFEVFDNFSKVYVSVEDLAVRIMHVDPDRLLFMFDERILIFLKSDSFYLPSVKTPKMAANPLKKTEIRRYTTEVPAFRPFFQRYGWTLCGRSWWIVIFSLPASLHLSHDMWFPTMWYFDKCRLRRACVASF